MKVTKFIAWEFPSSGWFKFNTDGASKRNQDLHGAATGHSGKSGCWWPSPRLFRNMDLWVYLKNSSNFAQNLFGF